MGVPPGTTRRRTLHAVATGAAVALAGCAHEPAFTVSGVTAEGTDRYTGESMDVRAAVHNRGLFGGTYVANLTVGGQVVDRESVRVGGRSRAHVTLSHRFEQPGTYAVRVGTSSAITVEVEPAVEVRRATPERSSLAAGEATTVFVSVENRADGPRTARLALSVDGTVRTERTVSLDAGSAPTVGLPVGFRRPGERRLAVNGVPAGVVSVANSWRQFGYDAANTGHDPDGLAPTSDVGVAWEHRILEGSRASPAAVGDTVYVGFGNPYAARDDGGMLALDAGDGEVRWRTETTGRMRSAAAIVDGTVVFGTVADGPVLKPGATGTVHGHDAATGRERWVIDVGAPVAASPTADGGIAYIGAFDSDGTVYALRADGSRRWTATVDRPVVAAPAVADGVVYVADFNGQLHALDAETGRERWVYATGTEERRRVIVGGPAVDGPVYVTNFTWDTPVTHGAIDAVDVDTGERRWRAETGETMLSSPAVADGTVYAGVGLSVGAWDAGTGRERWRLPAGVAGSVTSSAPAVVSDTVYVGTSGVNGGTLYALRPDGQSRWTVGADSGQTSPAVLDGTVYCVTGFGNVVALR